MTDRELLAEYASTDSDQAFAEIVKNHSGKVYGTCRRILGEPHAAEDATQAVFITLARPAACVATSYSGIGSSGRPSSAR